jgi:hypothetical protein
MDGRLKPPSVLCMLNYPLKQDVMSSVLNRVWVLELNGLALGQEGIECLLARSWCEYFASFSFFLCYI